jgi:pyruvate dehydrogenase kinase 2/3/4
MPESLPNPFLQKLAPLKDYSRGTLPTNDKTRLRVPMDRRYYWNPPDIEWPPAVHDYNKRFTRCLEKIKRRHDPTVTTVAGGVLEWKRANKSRLIEDDVQRFLDRFYMSRIGIRFLIGQRAPPLPSLPCLCWRVALTW